MKPKKKQQNTKNAVLTAPKQRKVIGKPFPKGVSGNPNGRPKGSISLTSKIKEFFETIGKGEKATYGDILVKKIWELALNDGNQKIIELIWNYVDGKPLQGIEIRGQKHFGENELKAIINYLPQDEQKEFFTTFNRLLDRAKYFRDFRTREAMGTIEPVGGSNDLPGQAYFLNENSRPGNQMAEET